MGRVVGGGGGAGSYMYLNHISARVQIKKFKGDYFILVLFLVLSRSTLFFTI